MPFCLSVSIIFITLSVFGLKVYLLSNSITLYTGLVFGFLAFFLWFKRLNEVNKIKTAIFEFCSPLFIMSLTLIAISNLNLLTYFRISKDLNAVLIFTCIFSGLITLVYYDLVIIKAQKNNRIYLKIKAYINKVIGVNNFFWLLIILVAIFNFILKLLLATKMNFHVDEGYTDLVTRGLFKYGEIGITESGIMYSRSILYNLINSFGYFLFDNLYLKVRFINILLFSLFIPYLYKIIKDFTKDKLFSLFSTFLIVNNWYIIIITMIARSYTLAIISSIITFHLLLKISKSDIFWKNVLYFVLLSLISFFSFIDISVLGIFHLIPLIGISFIFYLAKVNQKLRYFSIISFVLFMLIFAYYITCVDPTIIKTIINYISPKLQIDYIKSLFSLFSYINVIGLILTILVLILSFFKLKTEKYIFILSIWILIVIFFQGYIYGTKTFDFRYFFTIMIPIIFLYTYYTYSAILNTRIRKIGIIMLIITISTSLINVSNINNSKIDWIIQRPQPWETFSEQIPYGSVVITDFPIILNAIRPDLILYKFSYHPAENEVLNKKLVVPYTKQKFTEKEIKRFFDFIDQKNKTLNTVTVIDQDYDIYTGSPKIMNVDHLQKILSSNKNIYALFTYEIYKNRELYLEMYTIISNGKILRTLDLQKNPFDNREHEPMNSLNLLILE